MTRNHRKQLSGEALDADLLPWERQPEEGERAYRAFKEWLDSDKRRVIDHGPTAKNWSARYHWSQRAHEYDVYMARVDLDDQIRYRRRMNARHRQLGAVTQSKFVAWLGTLTEAKIAAMSTADAIRMFDVAVRIERAACSQGGLEDLPDWAYPEPAPSDGSLRQRLIDAGLDVEMSGLAQFLHKVLDPPAPVESPPRPPPEPLPDRKELDPTPPTGPELGFDEVVDTSPPLSIWGPQPSPFDTGRGRYGGLR